MRHLNHVRATNCANIEILPNRSVNGYHHRLYCAWYYQFVPYALSVIAALQKLLMFSIYNLFLIRSVRFEKFSSGTVNYNC